MLPATQVEQLWEKVHELIPKRTPKKGKRPTSDRVCFDALVQVHFGGETWESLPDGSPSLATCWRRAREWDSKRAWNKIWKAVSGELGLTWKTNSSPSYTGTARRR